MEDSQAKQRNEEIERMIRRDQKQRERQVKMLLLGTYSLDILPAAGPSLFDSCARRWRKWEVHGHQADVLNTQRGFLGGRKGTMARYNLQ